MAQAAKGAIVESENALDHMMVLRIHMTFNGENFYICYAPEINQNSFFFKKKLSVQWGEDERVFLKYNISIVELEPFQEIPIYKFLDLFLDPRNLYKREVLYSDVMRQLARIYNSRFFGHYYPLERYKTLEDSIRNIMSIASSTKFGAITVKAIGTQNSKFDPVYYYSDGHRHDYITERRIFDTEVADIGERTS